MLILFVFFSRKPAFHSSISCEVNASFISRRRSTLETSGELLEHAVQRGDATVFVSHKYHCVKPVTA